MEYYGHYGHYGQLWLSNSFSDAFGSAHQFAYVGSFSIRLNSSSLSLLLSAYAIHRLLLFFESGEDLEGNEPWPCAACIANFNFVGVKIYVQHLEICASRQCGHGKQSLVLVLRAVVRSENMEELVGWRSVTLRQAVWRKSDKILVRDLVSVE
jgi:hypothetical protein